MTTDREALAFVQPSLRVLAKMCEASGLSLGAAKAREMATAVDEALAGQWKCAASISIGAHDPQECDWPVCGCDPAANKVIDGLADRGLLASDGIEAAAVLVGEWTIDHHQRTHADAETIMRSDIAQDIAVEIRRLAALTPRTQGETK